MLGGANVNATTHTGTTVSMSGNVTGGNIVTSAAVSAATVSASGNITTAAIGVFNGSYIKVPTGTTDPVGTVPLGAAYYNTFNATWRVYNGVSWVNA